jgi:holin-like protein
MVRRTMGATPTVVCFQHSHIIKRLIMLAQLALLMAFQFIGEAVTTGLGITFPGPLCGMILLLFYLFVTGGSPKELSVVGTSLLDHLGLFFVPAGTAIVAYGTFFTRNGLPVIAALFVSTTVAIHVSGVIAERRLNSKRLEIDHAHA